MGAMRDYGFKQVDHRPYPCGLTIIYSSTHLAGNLSDNNVISAVDDFFYQQEEQSSFKVRCRFSWKETMLLLIREVEINVYKTPQF